MKSLKSLIALVICLTSVVLFYFFREVPKGQLWKEYSVLYVPVESSDKSVLTVLNDFSISDYICLSNQFLPINISKNSPEYSMLKLNIHSDDLSYVYDRNAYFFDKNNQYRIYYIPSDYSKLLPGIVKKLSDYNIFAQIDSKTQYPVILPIVFTILCLIFCVFSKKRFLFILSSLFSIIFVFANPFYQLVLAHCLLLLLLFIISNTWKRKDFLKVIIQKKYTIPILLLFFTCSIASSVFIFILSILEVLSIFGIYIIYDDFITWFSKGKFVPVQIKPAKLISPFAGTQFVVLSSMLVGMLIVFISLFLGSVNFSNKSSYNDILLPCFNSSSEQNDSLPVLNDYYEWYWNVQTYPYKSLNVNNFGSACTFTSFEQTESKIIPIQKQFIFNDEYKQSINTYIENSGKSSIEYLLKKQNDNLFPTFSSSGEISINNFSLIMCFICFFILLFIYFSIIIQKGVKK